MVRCQIVFGLLCSMVCLSYAAKPLFDPNKCPNGCQMDDQCPKNAKCSLLNDGGTCGFCVCEEGFKAQGNKCNPIKGYSTSTTSTTTTTTPTTSASTTATDAPTTATTSAATTATTTIPTTTGTTTQGPPPTPEPLNCADYDCSATPKAESKPNDPSSANNPSCKRQLVIPARPCSIQGGGACYGVYCLNIAPGKDICICPPYKTDRHCAVDKPGSCSKSTGQLPTGNTQLKGTRARNPSDKDNGSIYGRNFAANLSDCIKLCQWTQGACRAVNFGQIGGANVCEMLSIGATESNLLKTWLEKADGWQYALIGPAN